MVDGGTVSKTGTARGFHAFRRRRATIRPLEVFIMRQPGGDQVPEMGHAPPEEPCTLTRSSTWRLHQSGHCQNRTPQHLARMTFSLWYIAAEMRITTNEVMPIQKHGMALMCVV